MKTTILLTIEHTKDFPKLTDLIAGRVYTMVKNADASADVTAEIVTIVDVEVGGYD